MTTPERRAVTLRDLAPTGVVAGLVAAVSTTAVAAVARASGTDLEVDGTIVPLAAFAWWTAVGAVLGIVLARLLGDPRLFSAVTVVITALSLVPAVALPDDTATKLVLVGTHLVAAVIVIPALSRRLARSATGR